MYSCKNASPDEERSEESSTDMTTGSESVPVSSSAAAVGEHDKTRKFVRTADLKFRAKDVVKITYRIEDITARHGGFVAHTSLQSSTNHETTNKISADSSVVTTRYVVTNDMIIRVPNRQLDTVLKSIAPLIDFLDSRVIKADDVSLQMLSNDMSQNRSTQNEKRLSDAIDQKGKKLNDIVSAEDALAAKKEQADNAKLQNLALNDQVNFSTINISMYQREQIRREMIVNDDSRKYEQSFGSQLMDSLRTGWDMIVAILMFLLQLWAVVLLGVIIYIAIKKYKATNGKK
ncbi:MAG TPA: DUF4349 domain-containing protein [Flavobacterium sp.]|jgi:hypothetical protein